MTPQEMGRTLIERLRQTEQEARAHKEALYSRAGQADASIRADEVTNAAAHIGQTLREQGINLAATKQTPAAAEMWNVIENQLSKLDVPYGPTGGGLPALSGDPGKVVGLTVQALEQVRRDLVFLRSNAATDGDRRAAGAVMRAFDKWQGEAFERALLSGNPDALAMFRQAREANASWRQRFFNDEDAAGKLIEQRHPEPADAEPGRDDAEDAAADLRQHPEVFHRQRRGCRAAHIP
jgi:hypothetical protein